MWVNPDVDMPQTLISAQREGSLVVFTGGGVCRWVIPPICLDTMSWQTEVAPVYRTGWRLS